MKKVFLVLLFFVIFAGCSKDEKSEDNISKSEISNDISIENTAEINIDFKIFPKAKDYIEYLEIQKGHIEKIFEDETLLKFIFPKDTNDKYYNKSVEFAEKLESEGYVMRITDGTVTSVIVLESDVDIISIKISDAEHFKELEDFELDMERYSNGVFEIEILKKI